MIVKRKFDDDDDDDDERYAVKIESQIGTILPSLNLFGTPIAFHFCLVIQLNQKSQPTHTHTDTLNDGNRSRKKKQ